MARDLHAERVEATADPTGGLTPPSRPPITGDPRRIGTWLVIVGAVAQAAGLVIDVVKHASDPTLAAREALLTTENLGHVLLTGGIALVLAGVGLIVAGPWVWRKTAAIRAAIAVVLVLAIGIGAVAAANSSLSRGHDHGAAAASDDEGAPGHTHGHGDGTEPRYVALDAKTRELVSDQLVEARKIALAFQTTADAENAGYRAVTPYLPLIGAHYMKFVTVDGTFEITQPEMLLYDDRGKIAGLSYYVRSEGRPEGFAGPNDHWHKHIGLCVDADNPFVLGDEETTEEECRRRGGVKAEGADGWMVHAWVVPGWESPAGVFSAENAQLR